MQVLIVGGAGEVGRYLVKDFFQEGYEITVLDRAPQVPKMYENLPITYLQGDLTDVALVNKAVQGKEVIINLAWSFADDPPTVFGEDIKGHINLLEAASSAGVRSFLYTSTATVYGRAVLHPVAETHQSPLPGLNSFQEIRDVLLVTDLHEHLQDRFIGAPVQRTKQRRHRTGHGTVRVYPAGAD